MKLLYQTHSPYARKVLVLAYEKGLVEHMQVIHMETSPTQRNQDVFEVNPLGKVPVLIDGESVIYDSALICEYMNDKTSEKGQLVGKGDEYWQSKKLEALATGMADAGILARWEIARRPEAKRYQPFLDGQLLKLAESYRYIEENITLTSAASIGEIALATTLSWLEYVKLPSFKDGCPNLAHWYESFSERPSMLNTAYSGTTTDLQHASS